MAEKKHKPEAPKKAAADKKAVEADKKSKAAAAKLPAAEKAAAEAKAKSKAISAKLATTLPAGNSTIWSVAYSSDGKTLAIGSHRDSIKLWDVTGKKEKFAAPKKKE